MLKHYTVQSVNFTYRFDTLKIDVRERTVKLLSGYLRKLDVVIPYKQEDGDEINIYFHTDVTISGKGFHATYEIEPNNVSNIICQSRNVDCAI